MYGNSDFFRGSVTKEQLKHLFPIGCEQVWPVQNSIWFCNNQIFQLNLFPTIILRYSTSFPGLFISKNNFQYFLYSKIFQQYSVLECLGWLMGSQKDLLLHVYGIFCFLFNSSGNEFHSCQNIYPQGH